MRTTALLLLAAGLAGGSALADGSGAATNAVRRHRYTKDEIMARGRAYQLRKAGGLVVNRRNQRGAVVWANGQDFIPEGVIAGAVEGIVKMFPVEMPLRRLETPPRMADFAALEKRLGAEGLVAFLDERDVPTTLLVAPEGHWAVVNVAALAADNPASETLLLRVEREAWRAFAFAFGAADSLSRNCAMKPVANLRMLDELPSVQMSPEPANKINAHLAGIGVTPFETATYRTACEQGWAPEPTNEVQRAIWEKVYQMPANPMKIEFDPKKGR